MTEAILAIAGIGCAFAYPFHAVLFQFHYHHFCLAAATAGDHKRGMERPGFLIHSHVTHSLVLSGKC
ncbi:hypothetical protein NUBL22819_08550 [Klebsiella pneumoniae]|nr:hypothetical protein NUBL22819_08550 [Klebsiella pneumoniae]